jgi:hypothetical protein
MNVALARVLYAHTLVAAPRLALGRFALLARVLGDPRLGISGAFLSLRRVVPNRYPLARCRVVSPTSSVLAGCSTTGDRAAAAAPERVVRRGDRRTMPARAGTGREPDLPMAVRGATRLARSAHAVRGSDESGDAYHDDLARAVPPGPGKGHAAGGHPSVMRGQPPPVDYISGPVSRWVAVAHA